MNSARLHAASELPYVRRTTATTEELLAGAFEALLEAGGLEARDVDGLGVASFTLKPDRCIDMAWRLGLNIRWSLDDGHGGASGVNMLRHAIAAIECGHARHIALLAGDVFGPDDFKELAANYNGTTRQYLAPLGIANPNTLFALLTQRHMRKHGLERADYGALAVGQRNWASANPNAVYRSPLSLEDYLAAPRVADPLCIYDCVPVVAGANAILLSHVSALPAGSPAIRIKAIDCNYNFDDQSGDGLTTGLRVISDRLFANAGVRREELDLVSVYDDYPVMALVQLEDLGIVAPGELRSFLNDRVLAGRFPLNTSGGQLSAGQAGAAGGLHGLTEAALQLLGRAGERQLSKADRALVSGYGMVEYRYGMCANAAILERAQ
ncbi:thiolase family protein [Pigmentiphaga daeguensis]|uniref:Thiolase family protein n=1 Tax=Pigmentiphaga daeguensis TaxID=414049 RepID=A0ABP3N3U2_9BURK